LWIGRGEFWVEEEEGKMGRIGRKGGWKNKSFCMLYIFQDTAFYMILCDN